MNKPSALLCCCWPHWQQPRRPLLALALASRLTSALALALTLTLFPGGHATAQGTPVPTPDMPSLLQAMGSKPVLLLGEQHDADVHQQLQREVLATLLQIPAPSGSGSRRVAALVLEMAARGTSTANLPPDTQEDKVRAALQWDEAGWPWARYGPLVMQAVRAGLPVLGGNLPASEMRSAMAQAPLDTLLPASAMEQHRTNIREGHCNLLPEAHIPAMVRIQVARDVALAQTVQDALQPGKVVVLVGGNEHMRPDVGVPQHLAQRGVAWPDQVLVVHMRADAAPAAGVSGSVEAAATPPGVLTWTTPPLPPKDYCAELREQFRR